MKISLDMDSIRQSMEELAEQLVALSIAEAPHDTFDLHDSIRAGEFNPADLSIEVFIDPQKLGRDQKRQRVKPWNGMYYPEIVHKGHKTRNGKSFVAAIPFFERALEKLKTNDFDIKFRIVQNDY